MTCDPHSGQPDRPANEAARLAKLRELNILDNITDAELDHVTALVRMVFGVETALITLVDEDRQWVKSEAGAPVTLTPRDISFSAKAILQDDVMVVPDASVDPRFCDNPLVTGGLKVRFYAGAPLMTPDGFALGALCAIDPNPRDSFDETSQNTLAEMADVVMSLLLLRRTADTEADKVRRRQQREARRTEQIVQVMHEMSQGAMLINSSGVCEYANQQAAEVLGLFDGVRLEGFDVDPMIQYCVDQNLFSADLAARYHAVQANGGQDSYEIPVPGNRMVRCDIRGRSEGGCIITLSDITEEQTRKRALQQNGNQLRLMLDHIPALVFHKDDKNRHLQVNAAAAASLGMKREDVEGKHGEALYEKDVAAKYHRDDLEVIRSGVPKMGIVEPYAPKCGETRWVSTDKIPYTDPVTGEKHVFVVATDISAQRSAEEAARAQLARMEMLYNSAPTMLHTLDPEGYITTVSDFWLEVLGYRRDEVMGRHIGEFLHPESGDPFTKEKTRTFVRKGLVKDDTIKLLNAHGERVDVLAFSVPEYAPDGSIDRVITVLSDVTEWLSTKSRLAQAQKMESVGQLTSGLAHDFNNLLGVIVGNVQLIERGLDDPKALKRVSAALAAAESGADLTRRLLAFSRKRDMDVGAVDLTQSLTEFDGMVRHLIGETIDLQTCLTSTLPAVVADASQLESAILNLCVNARDAMPNGGQLTLEARTANIHAQDAEKEGCEAGRYVKVSVTDTGEGMDKDTLDKVLEPFFSTKAVGQGTGLGLSMVYAFVKQVGGFMRLYSEPGRGTTISMFLRAADEGASTDAAEHTAPEADPVARLPGQGRILVVEDQEAVRDVAVSLLEEMGFTTHAVESGDAALEVLESGEAFDLVFTDVVMPGTLDGVALAKAAQGRWPDLPFVFATGYAEASLLRSGDISSARNLVNKPYRRETLAETIADVLDRARRETQEEKAA